MKVQALCGQQAHHTHTECLSISLDSYHYPSLHPPFGSDPLYRSWPIIQSHPCSLHLSPSLFWHLHGLLTHNTHPPVHTGRHIQKRRAVPYANITPRPLVLTHPPHCLCARLSVSLSVSVLLCLISPCPTSCFTPCLLSVTHFASHPSQLKG